MSVFGAKAYKKLGLETDAIRQDTHALLLQLYDGALVSIQRARMFMKEGRVTEKCQAITLAIEIVDLGLRASVSFDADREFAQRLVNLYSFVTMRLLQANARGNAKALDEAAAILSELREAWAQIGPQVGAAGVPVAAAPAAPSPAAAAPAKVAGHAARSAREAALAAYRA